MNKLVLIGGAVGVLALLVGMGAGGEKPDVEPKPTPDPPPPVNPPPAKDPPAKDPPAKDPPPVNPPPAKDPPPPADPGTSGIDAKSLTELEKIVAASLAQSQPQTYPGAPQPQLQTRGDRGLADWLANIAYWRLYAVDQSEWVLSGKTAAPWVIPGAPWSAVWTRIRDYLVSLGVSNVKPAKEQKPGAEGTDSKLVTTAEKALAAQAKIDQPQTFPAAPQPNLQVRGERGLADWLANTIYWRLYVMADSAWVTSGRTAASWIIPGGSAWGAVWTRIRDYLVAIGVHNLKPGEKKQQLDETIKALLPFEKVGADAALLYRPNSVDPDLVPPPDNVRRPTQSTLEWLTNLAYWTSYISPGSSYIAGGNPAAPVKPVGAWIAVWKRFNNYIAARL